MSLAKRLEEAVREGGITEAQADRILARRAELWAARGPEGQMLMCFTDPDESPPPWE
jgi:hypothetical protein